MSQPKAQPAPVAATASPMQSEPVPTAAPVDSAEMQRIVNEEERVFARVLRTIEGQVPQSRGHQIDYDAELVSLRDQIRDARLEDIPPLVEEMERLQQVANRRAMVHQGVVDANSPYFGHLVLEEEDKKREVLIGRSTFLDNKTGVRIVDWRDAPVSRVYYRYEEGDDYDEVFGGKDVVGQVLIRRSVSITRSKLRRITAPQGSFRKGDDNEWRPMVVTATHLTGGQGAAMRPEGHHRAGQLGTGSEDVREDRHLAEITALIDPRQFELISKPTSGLVVIQGGAGSGKTTIGLHRLAYLAFQDRERFAPENMLVVVFNDALVRYISRVLPALGVEGIGVTTYEKWSEDLRNRHLPHLPKQYTDATPAYIVRFKKHPNLLRAIDAYAQRFEDNMEAKITELTAQHEGGARVSRYWKAMAGWPLAERLKTLASWLRKGEDEAEYLNVDVRHAVEREAQRVLERIQDLPNLWADLLTDAGALWKFFPENEENTFTAREREWIHAYCVRQCTKVLTFVEELEERREDGAQEEREVGVDGEDEGERGELDHEDNAIFLRLYQRLIGRLRARGGQTVYEHIFVDETQDMSPVELAALVGTVSEAQSITLAGDVAQKLYMDNGFTSWQSVLHELGLDHVAIEPLKLSYRSTHEILEFATDVLGPLRNEVSGTATRHGAPVELFEFSDSGEAVGFLAEALRNLVAREPLSSVCVISRYPEQADIYYKGLKHAEVPNLRRIAEQDFPFRPGVDVTDVRQVKGLEFDYVVMVESNISTYPADDEARHLLHIASTRAAHQLWVITVGAPSTLLPASLLQRSG